VPFSIYFIPKEAKGGKTKIPSCFLPPILLLSFYSLGLILFNFVSPSSRIRKRPGRLNRSRKKKKKEKTPKEEHLGFPSSAGMKKKNFFFFTRPHRQHPTPHTYVRGALFLFSLKEKKRKMWNKGRPTHKGWQRRIYREDYKKKRRGQECHSP
jgi:hypothetical protein